MYDLVTNQLDPTETDPTDTPEVRLDVRRVVDRRYKFYKNTVTVRTLLSVFTCEKLRIGTFTMSQLGQYKITGFILSEPWGIFLGWISPSLCRQSVVSYTYVPAYVLTTTITLDTVDVIFSPVNSLSDLRLLTLVSKVRV